MFERPWAPPDAIASRESDTPSSTCASRIRYQDDDRSKEGKSWEMGAHSGALERYRFTTGLNALVSSRLPTRIAAISLSISGWLTIDTPQSAQKPRRTLLPLSAMRS